MRAASMDICVIEDINVVKEEERREARREVRREVRREEEGGRKRGGR